MCSSDLVIITSTYGDGEPPDNAKAFWESLSKREPASMRGPRFSVCALGDSNYAQFCAFGRAVDSALERLGAERAHPRADCDADYESAFAAWMNGALTAFERITASEANSDGTQLAAQRASGPALSIVEPPNLETKPAPMHPHAVFGKTNPFPAALVRNELLSGKGSSKEVRHFEFEITGSGFDYEVGDALAVIPTNDPATVEALLAKLDRNDGGSLGGGLSSQPLREQLLETLDISKAHRGLIEWIANRPEGAEFREWLKPGAEAALAERIAGRDVLDILDKFPGMAPASELLGVLKKLQPRLYSISSSPKASPSRIALTVGIEIGRAHV